MGPLFQLLTDGGPQLPFLDEGLQTFDRPLPAGADVEADRRQPVEAARRLAPAPNVMIEMHEKQSTQLVRLEVLVLVRKLPRSRGKTEGMP